MVCISYNSPTLSILFQFSSPLSCILVCLNLVFTLLLVLSLILVQLQFPNSFMFATRFVLSQSLLSWHNRLGHPFQSRLQLLSNIVPDVSFSHSDLSLCIVCPLAKQKRLAFPNENNLCTSFFDLIQCDILGPFYVPTGDGFRYFLTIFYDYCRCTRVYLMKLKSNIQSILQSFFPFIETQFHLKIKSFGQIMDPNFPCLLSFLLRVLFNNIVVQTHPNRTRRLKESINTSLVLLKPLNFSPLQL